MIRDGLLSSTTVRQYAFAALAFKDAQGAQQKRKLLVLWPRTYLDA